MTLKISAFLLAVASLSLSTQLGGQTQVDARLAPDSDKTVANLVTSSIIEPFTEIVVVPVGAGHQLQLEPGIRATLVNGMYSMSTHDGAKVELESLAGRISLLSPATLTLTARGLVLEGGRVLTSPSLLARRKTQDDTDSNLKSMEESAKKLKTSLQNGEKSPGQKLRYRWLYGENPFPTAEIFNTQAIQQLVHCSPAGF